MSWPPLAWVPGDLANPQLHHLQPGALGQLPDLTKPRGPHPQSRADWTCPEHWKTQ